MFNLSARVPWAADSDASESKMERRQRDDGHSSFPGVSVESLGTVQGDRGDLLGHLNEDGLVVVPHLDFAQSRRAHRDARYTGAPQDATPAGRS